MTLSTELDTTFTVYKNSNDHSMGCLSLPLNQLDTLIGSLLSLQASLLPDEYELTDDELADAELIDEETPQVIYKDAEAIEAIPEPEQPQEPIDDELDPMDETDPNEK